MAKDFEKLYNEKDQAYFSNTRFDMISLIQGEGLKVLEIGCGNGATLLELKRTGKASEIFGIEITEGSIKDLKGKLNGLAVGNIEEIELDYPEGYFDIIIMGDVLEHLFDPWSVLKKIKKYLNQKGRIVASIPNIREFGVMKSVLFKGNFKYADSGILDKTHLRFFCKENIIEMFERDYRVIEIKGNPNYRKQRYYYLNRLTFGALSEFFNVQYLVVAEKK
jgi:2-polyprenyl-3-methyl-5-hydroxy-6-metoxy-1,4-benzoquinol methylase